MEKIDTAPCFYIALNYVPFVKWDSTLGVVTLQPDLETVETVER